MYVHFLSDLVPVSARPYVTICSLNAPTLSDEHWAEGYLAGQLLGTSSAEERARLRTSIADLQIPDIQQRTVMHAIFSRKLQSAAEKEGFLYLDDASLFLRPDGSQIDKQYYRLSGGRDVHIDIDEPALSRLEELLRVRVASADCSTTCSSGECLPSPAAKFETIDPDVGNLMLARPWRLERPNGDVRSDFVSFNPSGSISGYKHPNEVAWRTIGRTVAFQNAAGETTSRSSKIEREKSGRYVIHMVHASNANQPSHRLCEINPACYL